MQLAVRRRNIQSLYHFTKLENIDSIMTHGIVPRSKLNELGIHFKYNDELRLDGNEGASSFSIEFPNYKMFYPCRQSNTDQEWVVIGVDSRLLWEKECAFCQENAAHKNVTAIPIEQRKGLHAFNKLFEPVEDKPTRKELRLLDKYPTNPQAEVLIFDVVEPNLISIICCETLGVVNKLKEVHPPITVPII